MDLGTQRTIRDRGGSVALLVLMAAASVANPTTAQTVIRPSGSESGIEGVNGVFTIDDLEFGERPGGGRNLVFPFDAFDLGADHRALFTASSGLATQNVLALVTGGQPSHLDGTLDSSVITGADFFFLNPNGLLFGPSFRLNVPASFHASTANYLEFADGQRLDIAPAAAPLTSSAPLSAFGFLGPTVGGISTHGSRIEVRPGATLGFVGGDIAVSGGFLSAPGGELRLVSVASAGQLRGLDGDLAHEGFAELGGIRLVDEAVVSASSPRFGPDLKAFSREPDCSDLTCDAISLRLLGLADPRLLDFNLGNSIEPSDVVIPTRDLEGFPSHLAAVVRPGSIGGIETPLGDAGRVVIRGRGLLVEDSDVRALHLGAGVAGGIDIELVGEDLVARSFGSDSEVGISARSGLAIQGEAGGGIDGPVPLPIPDFQLILGGAGNAGDIRIRAANVRLEGGARISSTSFGSGAAGEIDVEVDASGSIQLSGADASGAPSGIFSNSQGFLLPGTPRPTAGKIDLNAGWLRLEDGGAIIAQTTGDQDAGDIVIDVGRLEVLSGSQIDNSTSAQALDTPLITPRPMAERTTGAAGNIQVSASESILIGGSRGSGFTGISTFSQARSEGRAGSISINTPGLQLVDGGALAVASEGEGQAGDITLDVRNLRMQRAALISGSSTADLTEGGKIVVNSQEGMEVRSESAISARSTGAGGGGNIELNSNGVVLVEGVASVQADAPKAQGGRITISAEQLLASPGAFDASGGTDGDVRINAPVTNLEGQVKPPPVDFLDASSLLLAECSARRTGDRAGSFTVTRWPGLPVSPSGPLLALDPIVGTPGFASEERSGAGSTEEWNASEPPPSVETARALARGVEALRGGNAAEAEARFAEAASESDGALRSDALRGAAQARQIQGAYAESIALLEESLRAAREVGDLPREAAALGQLGNAYVALREPDRAESYLDQSVALARRSNVRGLLARSLNNLGNQYAIQGRWDDARDAYAESTALAGEAEENLLAAQALANAGRVQLEHPLPREAAALLMRAKRLTLDLDGGAAAVALRVHLADSFVRLAAIDRRSRREGLHLAHRLLLEASGAAGAIEDPRLQSHVYGSLGALYAQEGGRDAEALYLTRRALDLAEQAQAPELLVRWYAQAGRVERAAADEDAAVASFGRAVEILEQTRPEARARYGSDDGSFQQGVAPVYLSLVDILLQQSGRLADPDAAQKKLRLARSTVERFKAAELRDYFQDECVAALEAKAQPIESLSANAAVVYPIVLPDRVELLVSSPSGIARYSVAISPDELSRSVGEFRQLLGRRTTRQYLRPAHQLYDLLIKPYAESLAQEGVDTLVFVPDGALRTIPMAALHDGDDFVVERFAIAVTPSLRLLAPRALAPSDTKFLLAGVSEAVQGFPELGSVPAELASIHALYGGEVLLDENFQLTRFEEAIRERRPGIVHLASHATFTGDPRTSFVLTHDEKLTMDRLSDLVSASRFSDEPLELLLLSACETAAGDDRAALGLSGVAIRAGARSAMGSLWSVDDRASAELVLGFYEEWGDSGQTKAQALQQAQLSLMAQPGFEHPFYWAGFLVINNWL